MCFLPTTADTGHRTKHYAALMDYVKLSEIAAKDGPFHGTDFVMRSQAGL